MPDSPVIGGSAALDFLLRLSPPSQANGATLARRLLGERGVDGGAGDGDLPKLLDELPGSVKGEEGMQKIGRDFEGVVCGDGVERGVGSRTAPVGIFFFIDPPEAETSSTSKGCRCE